MSDNPPLSKRDIEGPALRARLAYLKQLKRLENSDGSAEIEKPEIKKTRLASFHQPSQILTTNAQPSASIDTPAATKTTRDSNSQAANQVNTNRPAHDDDENVLDAAIAALDEAESRIASAEEATKQAKIALEGARKSIVALESAFRAKGQ